MIESEALEAYHDRVCALDSSLAKLKSAEVSRAELVEQVATVAKEWLRIGQQLRSASVVAHAVLDKYDEAVAEVLNSTRQRTRASTFRARLAPLVEAFYDDVVIPAIRIEGSPAQVAARQLQAVFDGDLSTDEASYVEEAARCAGTHCNRAAIILLWAAAVARMHTAVQRIGFDTYNASLATAAARKGYPFNKLSKGASLSSLPELQRGRDFDLLVVGMDLWKYDLQAYEELDRLLGLRNSAAHPGMFHPSTLEVQQFAQKVHRFVFQAIGK
jgi:hypothetical protein